MAKFLVKPMDHIIPSQLIPLWMLLPVLLQLNLKSRLCNSTMPTLSYLLDYFCSLFLPTLSGTDYEEKASKLINEKSIPLTQSVITCQCFLKGSSLIKPAWSVTNNPLKRGAEYGTHRIFFQMVTSKIRIPDTQDSERKTISLLALNQMTSEAPALWQINK